MSEVYIYGGNSYQELPFEAIAGQIFRPHYDHFVHWVDIDIFTTGIWRRPKIEIYRASGDLEPVGELHTYVWKWPEERRNDVGPMRCRYAMQGARLHKDLAYCLLLYGDIDPAFPVHGWHYDKDDSEYPRGHRIYKAPGLDTWEHFTTQDHMFAEWGGPRHPRSRYYAPIANLAILGIQASFFYSTACISLTTTVPCRLTCYYTKTPPRKYMRSRITRGLSVPWHVKFSFSAFDKIDQIEHGETLNHSFLIPDWTLNQRKWLTFRGNIEEKLSPSIGPIFHLRHPGGPEQTTILRPNQWGDITRIPYENGEPGILHYMNVNESIPDEDTTCIWNGEPYASQWRYDLYTFPSIPIGERKISKVTITIRYRRQGGYAYVKIAKAVIKTHGTEYQSEPFLFSPDTYTNGTWELTTNPFTNEPWTDAEINSLQAGPALFFYRGVGWSSAGYCTQVFITVELACPFEP